MTKEEYTKFLKSPEWEAISEKRKQMDDYECQCCGNTRNLVVHHTDYLKGDKGLLDLDHLVTLCYRCHSIIHGKWDFDEDAPKDNANYSLSKKKQFEPPLSERFSPEEGTLLIDINDFCQKRSFSDAESENRFWPVETDFAVGPMRDIFKRWRDTEKNGLLKKNTLELLTYDVYLYIQDTKDVWWKIPAWHILKSVRIDNPLESGSDEQMCKIVSQVIDIRLKTYTRQRDGLVKRLEILPDGEDRDRTDKLLRETLSYIAYLKEASGTR